MSRGAAARSGRVVAQDEAVITPPAADTLSITERAFYENLFVGQFAPGKGFDLIHSKAGSLNISLYGLFRYLNQLPANQTYTDHLGRVRPVKTKNDLNWHRTFVWLTGFFIDPRFRYNISLWSLPTTQQTLLFGNLRYTVSQALTFGVGLGPNLTKPLAAGFVALLGRKRPADGGGFSARRVLVFVLRHRHADRPLLLHRVGEHQHQPARSDGRQRHARHGLQRQLVVDADDRRVRTARGTR
jgi:hypothetical protein